MHTITLLIYIYKGDRPSPVNWAQRPCIPLHYLYIYIYIEGRWTPWSIKHRGLGYRYTAYIYIYICVCVCGRWSPWSMNHKCVTYHYTAYIYIYTDEIDPLLNWSQRHCIPLHCLYIYIREMNPPGQLSTEALHTTTLLIYIYQGDEPLWSIDHKCLAYHYTAYIYISIQVR